MLGSQYFDASDTLIEKIVYGADGGQAATYYGVSGQAYGLTYTSYELDYNALGSLVRRAFFTADGNPLEVETYNADGSTIYDVYQVSGQSYSSFEVVDDASGAEISQRVDYPDGSHELSAYQSNAVLNATTGPDTIYISNSDISTGWGVTVNFPSGFGHDAVYGFSARAMASDASHPADTLALKY